MRVTVNFYTVVRHSGYGFAGKEDFRHGLEPRHVGTAGHRDIVKKVGGLLFNTYGEADDYCFNEQYAGHDELIPKAPGRFAPQEIDGLQIYIPASTDHISFDDAGVVKEVKNASNGSDSVSEGS
jgi:hypothetical protein